MGTILGSIRHRCMVANHSLYIRYTFLHYLLFKLFFLQFMTPWKSRIKILTSLHFSEIYFQVLTAAFSSSCGPFSGLANIPWGKKILSLYSQILLPFLFPVPSMFSFLSCCYGCLCFLIQFLQLVLGKTFLMIPAASSELKAEFGDT